MHTAFTYSASAQVHINSAPLTLRKWTKIEISRTYDGEEENYFVSVKVDGVVVDELEVNEVAVNHFANVHAYAGDPWYEPQDGYIRNLVVLS